MAQPDARDFLHTERFGRFQPRMAGDHAQSFIDQDGVVKTQLIDDGLQPRELTLRVLSCVSRISCESVGSEILDRKIPCIRRC